VTLLPARRSDAFAALLDAGPSDGPVGLHTGGLALAEQLRAAGPELATAAVPRQEFRSALRTRLVAVAAVQPYATPTPTSAAPARRHRRGLVVASGAVASVVAVSGVSFAAGRSLPGDPLYGLKRGTEALQLRTASGDLERGRDHLRFAATRLREARALAEGRHDVSLPSWAGGLLATPTVATPRTERLVRALDDMDRATEAGRRLLLDAWVAAPGDQRPMVALARFGAAQQRGLTALLPLLPPGVQDRALASLSLVTDVAAQGSALCAGCGTGPTSPEPSAPSATLPSGGSPVPGTPGSAAPPVVPPLLPVPSAPPGATTAPLPTDAGQRPGTPPSAPALQPSAPPTLPVPLPTGDPVLPTGSGHTDLPLPLPQLFPTALPEAALPAS
jgi:Domain of unknown function (DUF5667)